MNIVVNTRFLIKNKLDGIGVFTFEIFKRICKAHPEHQFYFLFDRPYAQDFIFSDNITPLIVRPKARHPILWYLWFHIALPKILKRINADIFISPDGFIPLKLKIKTISVIHDLNFIEMPENLPFLTRHYYNFFFPKYARSASKVITVSKFSEGELKHHLNIKSSKIGIVYNGCNDDFKPMNKTEIQEVKISFTDGKDFFIHIGSLHPRKNIVRLIKAFDAFKNETKSDMRLVLVGQKFFLTKNFEKAYNHSIYKNDIIFTGRLNQVDLIKLTGSASALILVSLYEGFGIPLSEAMNSDVPIICSNVTAMPEIAGDAALYVDPLSIDSIKTAMKEIFKNDSLKRKLTQKGRERRELFNWSQSAKEMWNIIENVLEV